MKSPFHDPNNHAPEVSAGDGWEDADGTPGGPPPALPGKRRTGKPQGRSAVEKDPGPALRIEPKELVTRPAGDPAVRLEVQELGRGQADEPKATSKPIVPRQVMEPGTAVETVPDWRVGTGEGREWGKQPQEGSMRWMLYWGLGITLLMVGALVLKPILDRQQSLAVVHGLPNLEVVDDGDAADLDQHDPYLLLETHARRVFGEFSKARTLEEVIRWVRDGERLREVLAAEWQPKELPENWAPGEETRLQAFVNEGMHYGVVSGTLPDFAFSEAYLVVTGDRVLVDWEASTARGTATFEELRRGEGDPSFIRAALSPTDFYTATFPEREYQSLLLNDLNPNSLIWGYVRRGDPVERKIAALFTPGFLLKGVQNEYRLCLKLERGPAGSLPNQWLIGELLHMDWVRP